MKLTYICGFAWEPKGTVRSRAFPMAEEMVRRGHEVTLIIVPYDNRAHSGKQFTRNGVHVVNVEIKNRTGSLARVPYELIRKIDESRPDLVHVFKPKGFAGLAGMWLLLRNRPFVLDCDDWEGWDGWNGVKNYPWLVKEFIDFQEKLLLRRAPLVTVASQGLFERSVSFRSRKTLINPKPKSVGTEGTVEADGPRSQHQKLQTGAQVFYVPNGPSREQLELCNSFLREDPQFYKQKFGVRGAPVILYAGQYDPVDDVMFLCRALSQTKPRASFKVVFVGDGPELSQIRAFFAAHPDIHAGFLGSLPVHEYVQLVAASEICAFPYPDTPVYRAKCSARIIDYMLYGKAVATTSVGENLEYIVNEESGLLTKAGDEAAFAQALTRLIENEELRNRLGANARTRILQKFLWSGSAGDNCERAYRSLVPQEQIEPATLLAS